MKTAKVFKSGNSQAVKIPKEFHLKGSEVEIQKKGEVLILRPKKAASPREIVRRLSNSLKYWILCPSIAKPPSMMGRFE